MIDSVFLDTNVLVYVFDRDATKKQARARRILAGEGAAGRAFISTQVLQEFYVTVTRKLARPLPVADAERAVIGLATLPVVQLDTATVLAAIRASQVHQLSFWDALIVQAALDSGCTRLLSEDMQHGREIGTLRIENPFVPT
jgi:predicted nucleic acid-binding protein